MIFGGILHELTICRFEDVDPEKYELAGDCDRRNEEPLKEKRFSKIKAGKISITYR